MLAAAVQGLRNVSLPPSPKNKRTDGGQEAGGAVLEFIFPRSLSAHWGGGCTWEVGSEFFFLLCLCSQLLLFLLNYHYTDPQVLLYLQNIDISSVVCSWLCVRNSLSQTGVSAGSQVQF